MTPIPAKVLTVDKQSSQYRVLVQIELDKYLGSFHTFRFGKKIPFTGSCHNGQLDLFYYRDPGLKKGNHFRSGRFSDGERLLPEDRCSRHANCSAPRRAWSSIRSIASLPRILFLRSREPRKRSKGSGRSGGQFFVRNRKCSTDRIT